MENSTIVGYDSRSAVAELLCNRSSANVPHWVYTLRLKWNLDPKIEPWEWVRVGKKEYTVFVNVEMKIVFFFFGFIIFYFSFYFMYILDGGLQKRHVIVTSVDRYCRYSGGVLRRPNCWSSCNVQENFRAGELDDGRVWLVMLRVCGTWAGEKC